MNTHKVPILEHKGKIPTKPARLIILLIGTLILVAMMGYLIQVMFSRPGSLSYSSSDVVYGQPLHAVHGMEMPPSPAHFAAITDSTPSNPRLEAPVTFYDFGSVDPDQVVSRVFELANRGSAPLLITAAHTTCTCTTADLTATEIPPGKILLITLHFDPRVHNLSGQTVRRGLIVETNDHQNPSVDFWIQATVK